jgi:hypothetical protein
MIALHGKHHGMHPRLCQNAAVSSIFRQQASRANGAKSRGPITEEGKRASAANSALSTGPVTPEGKARVSMNALDHGLLAKSVILPEENREAFLVHLENMMQVFQPVDYAESFLVESMAVVDWKRLRAWCCEMAAIAHATRLQQMSADDVVNEMHQEIPAMLTALAMKNLADTSHYLELVRRYEVGSSRESRRIREELYHRRELRHNSKITEQSEPNIGQILIADVQSIENGTPVDSSHVTIEDSLDA